MRAFITALLCTFLIGCVTNSGIRQNLNNAVQQGASVDYMIGQAGYPTDSFTLPNGNEVLVYTQSREVSTPETTYYNQYMNSSTSTGGGSYSAYCTIFLEFRNDRLFRWNHKGNNCNI